MVKSIDHLFHQAIEITVRLLTHPREDINIMLKLRSEWRGFRDESIRDARRRTQTE